MEAFLDTICCHHGMVLQCLCVRVPHRVLKGGEGGGGLDDAANHL
jgi:hypothetical protein